MKTIEKYTIVTDGEKENVYISNEYKPCLPPLCDAYLGSVKHWNKLKFSSANLIHAFLALYDYDLDTCGSVIMESPFTHVDAIQVLIAYETELTLDTLKRNKYYSDTNIYDYVVFASTEKNIGLVRELFAELNDMRINVSLDNPKFSRFYCRMPNKKYARQEYIRYVLNKDNWYNKTLQDIITHLFYNKQIELLNEFISTVQFIE